MSFLGKCPDYDFPYENLYTPANCQTDATATSCTKVLLPNGVYPYHAPAGTLCNNGANVCTYRGCTDSICTLYNSTDSINGSLPSGSHNASANPVTECVDSTNNCIVACLFSSGVCTTTAAYASTPHGTAMGVALVNRAQGRTCASGTGFCNGQGACVTQSSDTPFESLLALDSSWFIDYWYVTIGITLFFAILPFLLRWSYGVRDTKIRVRERMSKFGRSVMKTMGRDKHSEGPAHLASEPARRAGTRAQGAKVIALDLEDQHRKNFIPDDAYHRLQTLFPTAKPAVLKHLIKISPHEEACVSRLLRLGYPMWLAPDYRAFAHAGRRAKRQARATAAAWTGKEPGPQARPPQARPPPQGQQGHVRPTPAGQPQRPPAQGPSRAQGQPRAPQGQQGRAPATKALAPPPGHGRGVPGQVQGRPGQGPKR